MPDYYFIIAASLSALLGLTFSYFTRNIFYATPDTDNELMVYAAAQSHKWRLPSDIHKYGAGKTSMKDISIILLALFQRIMGDKESDHPYATLSGTAVSVSAILIYFIGDGYFGPLVGLSLALLYLFSFWPWQVALYGGHANIAGAFFLGAVYLVQISALSSSPNAYLILAGACLCCALFSSASSSKLLIPFWASIFYAQYSSFISAYDYLGLYSALPFQNLISVNLTVAVGLTLALIAAHLSYKRIVRDMYFKRGPSFLKDIIKNQKEFPLDHYLAHAKKKMRTYSHAAIWIVGIPLFAVNTIAINHIWPLVVGFLAVFILLGVPDLKKSIKRYFMYFLLPQRKTHFVAYIPYFAKKGITIYPNTRGAGWRWLPKIYGRFIPIHVCIFSVAVLSVLLLRLYQSQLNMLPIDMAIVALSISPIWWAEFTGAPQISRSYSLSLITLLLAIGHSMNAFPEKYYPLLITAVLIATLAWNLWKFLSDIYPARMSALNLLKTLTRLDIKEIYTYRTNYNKCLVETIPGLGTPEFAPRKKIEPPIKVHYVKSLDEVAEGWIVIPGTNGKAVVMDSEPEALNDDFRYTKDPALVKLLASKDIEKVATAKFKTYGTSRIWPLECEPLGYLDLVLNDIGPDDLFRGYAWLVNSKDLRSLL